MTVFFSSCQGCSSARPQPAFAPAAARRPRHRLPAAPNNAKGTIAIVHTNAAAVKIDSIDGIVNALYDSVSFAEGERPTWDRFRSLFQPSAVMVRVNPRVTREVADCFEVEMSYFAEILAKSGKRQRVYIRSKTLDRQIDAVLRHSGGFTSTGSAPAPSCDANQTPA